MSPPAVAVQTIWTQELKRRMEAKPGFERVQAHEGGLEDWRAAGFPAERV